MDSLNWFKIQCIYPLTSSLLNNDESDEDETLKRIRLESMESDGYGREMAIMNLGEDPIASLVPGCFVPKAKTNKVHYTEIVFASGRLIFASGKPDDVYDRLNEYVSNLPTDIKDKE